MLGENEMKSYRKKLERRIAELEEGVHGLDRIAVETAAEVLENLQLATERDVAIIKLDREARLLAEARNALARMADGSYGICQECEQPIPRGRLDALPWAVYCVRCQEALDHRHKGSLGVDPDWEAA